MSTVGKKTGKKGGKRKKAAAKTAAAADAVPVAADAKQEGDSAATTTTTSSTTTSTAPAPADEGKEEQASSSSTTSTSSTTTTTTTDALGLPTGMSKILDERVTGLCTAAAAGDVDTVKDLITSEPIMERLEFVNLYDADGKTALFHALAADTVDDLTAEKIKTAHLLLQYGSDPNHQDDKRMSVLHHMCLLNYKPIIPKLIYYGANTMLENWEYRVCYQLAKTDAIRQSLMALINQTLDDYKDDVKSKTIYVSTLFDRCYLRSLYDVIDERFRSDKVKFEDVAPLMETEVLGQGDNVFTIPDPNMILQFFGDIDRDANGWLSIEEFMHTAMKYVKEQDKGRKKRKRKGKKRKGKKSTKKKR